MKLKLLTIFVAVCFITIAGYAQDGDLSDLDSLDMISEEEVTETTSSELESSDFSLDDAEEEEAEEEVEDSAVKIGFNGYLKAMNYWSETTYSRALYDIYKRNNANFGEDTNPDKQTDEGYDVTGIRTQLQMEGYLGDKAKFYSAINMDFNASEDESSSNNTDTVKNNKEAQGEDLRIVEAYIEIYEGSRTWKVGTQLVTWGFVDGFETPTDRVNARDNQYFSTEYEDTKLGSTGVLMTQNFEDAGSFDLLYIPQGKTSNTGYAQENLFAGGEETPDSSTANTKYAARYYGSLGKFDYAVSYVVGTDPNSDVKFVQKSTSSGGSATTAQHVYHRVKSTGVDLQYNFSDFIFKGGYVAYETSDQFDDREESAEAEPEYVKNDWREVILGGEFMVGSATVNLYAGQRFIDDWNEGETKNTYTGQTSGQFDYISGYISGDFLTGDALNIILYTSQFWDEHGEKVMSKNKLTLTYKIDNGLEVLFSPVYYDMNAFTMAQMQVEAKYSF